jgi:hypothetical protein
MGTRCWLIHPIGWLTNSSDLHGWLLSHRVHSASSTSHKIGILYIRNTNKEPSRWLRHTLHPKYKQVAALGSEPVWRLFLVSKHHLCDPSQVKVHHWSLKVSGGLSKSHVVSQSLAWSQVSRDLLHDLKSHVVSQSLAWSLKVSRDLKSRVVSQSLAWSQVVLWNM